MSEFWSGFVIVLIIVVLGTTVFLFLWGPRVEIPTQPDGTSGHVWAHGVLREGVRRLPTWWIAGSAIVLVASLGYLALYPGFGAFKGVLGWTSHGELASDQAANRQREAPLRERIRGKPVESIATDPDALRAGHALYIDNCAACHGRDGRGNTLLGAPAFVDSDWLYGGDGKSILTSILDGRTGYCEHAAMAEFSEETRALLERLFRIAEASRRVQVSDTDVVHFDFSPYNVLTDGARASGVVDWHGATNGDASFDLVNLAHYTFDYAVRDQLLTAAAAQTDPDALVLYAAHMVLRSVDWTIRHHEEQLPWFLGIGTDLLSAVGAQ